MINTEVYRLPYTDHLYVRNDDTLIVKARGGKERRIPAGKWWMNKNTPVGDDADLYEEKPYGGRKWISWRDVIAVERKTL